MNSQKKKKTRRQHGSVTAFLCIILVPIILVAVLGTDVARLFASRVIISDAGEMAMNAALVNYDEKLLDQYGLFALEPGKVSSDAIEPYFKNSLDAGTITGAEDYGRILNLLESNFKAIEVNNSEIYHTEVEKQQIIEYMKYRAPVCITEFLIEKFDAIKDTKKSMKAVEDEIAFAESMEAVADSFEDVLADLNKLLNLIENFPKQGDINDELGIAERIYRTVISRMAVAHAASKNAYNNSGGVSYGDVYEAIDELSNIIENCKKAFGKSNYYRYYYSLDENFDVQGIWESFEYYEDACALNNSIKQSGDLEAREPEEVDDPGPVQYLEAEEPEEGEEPPEPEIDPEWQAAHDAYEAYLVEKAKWDGYVAQLESCDTFLESKYDGDYLYPYAYTWAKDPYDYLNPVYNTACDALSQIDTISGKLEKVREKINMARTSYDTWDGSTENMTHTTDQYKNMRTEADEYKDFFEYDSEENGLANIIELEEIIGNDRIYFEDVKNLLEWEKMCGEQIVIRSNLEVVDIVFAKAHDYVGSSIPDEIAFGEMVHSLAQEYLHVGVESSTYLMNIMDVRFHEENGHQKLSYKDSKFYQQLVDYCGKAKQTSAQKTKQIKDSQKYLSSGNDGADEAKDTTGYPEFDWSSVTEELPSVKLGYANFTNQTSDNCTAVGSKDSDINDKSSRKKVVDSGKNSLKEATTFLEKADKILTEGLASLYVAEYGMQMFSYYNMNKKTIVNANNTFDLEVTKEEDLKSISGYKLKTADSGTPFKSEIEYLVWGNKSSVTNIKSTLAMIFAIRMAMNAIYVFTDNDCLTVANTAATSITAAYPYLQPIVKVAFLLAMAAAETSTDIKTIKEGHGVAFVKTKNEGNFKLNNLKNDVRKGVRLDYGEYLRLFLWLGYLTNQKAILARIGDCIQVNADSDITKEKTMIAISADVEIKTTFLKYMSSGGTGAFNINFDSASGSKTGSGNNYVYRYRSVLGY